jgi:hypothetical protein
MLSGGRPLGSQIAAGLPGPLRSNAMLQPCRLKHVGCTRARARCTRNDCLLAACVRWFSWRIVHVLLEVVSAATLAAKAGPGLRARPSALRSEELHAGKRACSVCIQGFVPAVGSAHSAWCFLHGEFYMLQVQKQGQVLHGCTLSYMQYMHVSMPAESMRIAHHS